jgi:hypothetical protein
MNYPIYKSRCYANKTTHCIYITKINCIYESGRDAIYSENQTVPTAIFCGRNRALFSSNARGTHRDLFHMKDQDCCDSVLFDFELRITPMCRPTTDPDVRPSNRPTPLPAMLLSLCLIFKNHKALPAFN